MKYINKWSVGAVTVAIVLSLLGVYNVVISDNKIEVSLDSDKCGTALLRVTKDDFTLKCGRLIAFQADTIVEYYKTYGKDEWVRNQRFVGRNKKNIDLTLVEYEDSFDIIRTTRYRKGRQSIEDGTLKETYTFTKNSVKISYDYEVKNKAKHRISMRIKKQRDVLLDAFDPNGNTGIRTGNLLYYEGYGDLLIDPNVILHSPATGSKTYNEGDTASFICNVTRSGASETITNVSFYWNAHNGSDNLLLSGATVILANVTANVTFSRVIPHQSELKPPRNGSIYWNCYVCNTSGCEFNGTNFTFKPLYKPDSFNITSDNIDYNFLNGTSWGANLTTKGTGGILNHSAGIYTHLFINWTSPPHPNGGKNLTWFLYYRGTLNTTTVRYTDFRCNNGTNSTVLADFNLSALPVDSYYVTLQACTTSNKTLCTNDTLSNPIDVFDYLPSFSDPSISKLRFSPQPNVTKGAALGQNGKGIIQIDWLGSGAPDGEINLTMDIDLDSCANLTASYNDSHTSGFMLINNRNVSVIHTTTSDPAYIWLWIDKEACGTTTTAINLRFEVLT